MKKLKRMTSFLMLAVMVVSIIGVMPKTAVYADNGIPDGQYFVKQYYNFTTDELKGIYDTYSYQPHIGDVKAYCAYNSSNGHYNIFFVSKHSFGLDVKKTDYKGNVSGSSFSSSSCSTCVPNLEQGVMYYHAVGFEQYSAEGRLAYHFSSNLGRTLVYTDDLSTDDLIMIILGGKTNDSCHWVDSGDTDAGTADNPIEDKDIGTIILKSHAFIPVKNNSIYPLLPQTDDSTFAYYRFKYKDKTSSGFSISNNKYARTFIQVRVQNQCVLLDPNDRNVVKEFYKHYGEFYQYKNIPTENISDNIFKVSWDDITLKWSDFTEHPNSTNKKLAYRFMIRVICTDSLTVVPDEKSGWHAGGWRSIVFDGSNFVEETNGHVTDDGKWTDDKDDGHNNSSDKTTDVPKSEDEANDSMNDSSSNSSTNFVDKLKQAKNAFDTANEYIKQVLKVPTMLGKLFSFFPDWVLYPFEFAFALIPWIIIYKLLRG